jgi:hypothetical protein
MNTPALVLKNPKGWFAAGAEVEKALTLLSDGAFKLFVYLCLNARRDTATLQTTQTELALRLKKGPGAIRQYLSELQTQGVCRSHFSRSPAVRGQVEILEPYWPYHKASQSKPDERAEKFVAAVKQLLQARPCVQSAFSTSDEILAHHWFQHGLSLERIEQAILLGCVRKYASWRNNPRQGPIRSLHYFQSVIEELDQQNVGLDYWKMNITLAPAKERRYSAGHEKPKSFQTQKHFDGERVSPAVWR